MIHFLESLGYKNIIGNFPIPQPPPLILVPTPILPPIQLSLKTLLGLLVALQALLVIIDEGIIVAETNPGLPTPIIIFQNLLIVIESLLVLAHSQVELGSEAEPLLEFGVLLQGLVDGLH